MSEQNRMSVTYVPNKLMTHLFFPWRMKGESKIVVKVAGKVITEGYEVQETEDGSVVVVLDFTPDVGTEVSVERIPVKNEELPG